MGVDRKDHIRWKQPIHPTFAAVFAGTSACQGIGSERNKIMLLQTVRNELIGYFRHLASRVERAVRALPRELIYVKPFSFGNSVGHLVLHLTGNLNHYIGAGIAGTGYQRNRPLEFTEPNPPMPEEALARFHEAVAMVVRTIESMDAAGLATPVANQLPITTRFGLFLVCAAHINNHVGQMSYLVQAHGRCTDEPPVW
jgi:uncharacterized damage-inducible protein DinB